MTAFGFGQQAKRKFGYEKEQSIDFKNPYQGYQVNIFSCIYPYQGYQVNIFSYLPLPGIPG